LSERVCRHLAGIDEFLKAFTEAMPDRPVILSALPAPEDIREQGIGPYLNPAPCNFDELAEAAGQPEADPFDLLCHLAFNAPLRTRRERAQRLKQDRQDFFERYGPEARAVLEGLLEKYAEHGDAQFVLPDVLKGPPLSAHGQIGDIIALFGGPERLRSAVSELQNLLYAA